MKHRNANMYTLWWTSSDHQTSMWGGDYESEAAAWAARPDVEKEFRAQCSDDCPYDDKSIWEVEPPEQDD